MTKIFRGLFSHDLKDVYLANIFFSLHAYLIIYINSPFLDRFISPKTLGLLFAAGSLVNIYIMLRAPEIIARFGIRIFALAAIVAEAIGIIGMILSKDALWLSLFFIIHQTSILLIVYVLDLFLEKFTRSENSTGRVRSIFLTASSATLVVSPFIVGQIVNQTASFVPVYILASIFLIPLFFIIAKKMPQKISSEQATAHFKISHHMKRAWKNTDLRGVIMTRFILEFFYAWMVIYMALHLNLNLHFAWSTIGLLFSIMLTPFLMFELPLGIIADKRRDEKEIILIGFFFATISTVLIPFLHRPVFLLWAALLFLTRVGASFVEIGTESYFFKHVKAEDSDVVSAFRMTRPLALLIAPVLASGTFLFVSLGNSFFILAAIISLGFITTAGLKRIRL